MLQHSAHLLGEDVTSRQHFAYSQRNVQKVISAHYETAWLEDGYWFSALLDHHDNHNPDHRTGVTGTKREVETQPSLGHFCLYHRWENQLWRTAILSLPAAREMFGTTGEQR